MTPSRFVTQLALHHVILCGQHPPFTKPWTPISLQKKTGVGLQDFSKYWWCLLTIPVYGRMSDSVGWLLTPISTPFSARARGLGTIFHRSPRQQGSANKMYLCEIWKVESRWKSFFPPLQHTPYSPSSHHPWGFGAAMTSSVVSQSFLTSEWQQQF